MSTTQKTLLTDIAVYSKGLKKAVIEFKGCGANKAEGKTAEKVYQQ